MLKEVNDKELLKLCQQEGVIDKCPQKRNFQYIKYEEIIVVLPYKLKSPQLRH